MNNVTDTLVQRVFSTPKWEDLRPETKGNLKKGLFDYIVCCHTSVANDEHFERIWNAKMYPEMDSDGVPVIGLGKRVHPFDACLINGYSAHALDLDDVHSEIRGHPSAVILSLLFSLVDPSKENARFYEAYLIGVEVMTRFAKLLGRKHYEKGFHTTATAGLYGAACAGAYYLDFSREKFNQTLDLCVSQMSGSRSHFGTMIKPLHAGLAAQKAWQILHFVQNGVVGSSDTIAGKNGLLEMYGGGNVECLVEDWGSDWAIDEPGLWFKLYPCCSANAHPIDATLEIMEKHAIDPEKIASIQLYFPKNGDAALVYTSPRKGEEGRFSAEYCVALLLLGKELSIEAFSVNPISDDVQFLMKKMKRKYDEDIPFAEVSYPKNRYCIVEISMNSGEVVQARCDVPLGSPGRPLGLIDLMEKAKNVLGEKAEPLIQLFQENEVVQIEEWMQMELR